MNLCLLTQTIQNSDVKVLVEIFHYEDFINFLNDLGEILCQIERVFDDYYVIVTEDLGLFKRVRPFIRIITYNEEY